MIEDITSKFGNMSETEFDKKINTPSSDLEYFNKFHKPLVERAIKRNKENPINLLDVACGYCHELNFLKDNEKVILWGLDISDKVLSVARKNLPRAKLITYDVRKDSLPFELGSMDVAIAVNAVVYCPDHMLKTLYDAIKKDGEVALNFRDYKNPYNRPFYQYYLDDGGEVYDQILKVGNQEFILKVLDYRKYRDKTIRNLDRQAYFQGRNDIERFIRTMGFEIVEHQPFNFKSPVNPDNQMDVYLLRKSS